MKSFSWFASRFNAQIHASNRFRETAAADALSAVSVLSDVLPSTNSEDCTILLQHMKLKILFQGALQLVLDRTTNHLL